MLRFKILASVVPLTAARAGPFPSGHPCIGRAVETVEIRSAPWHADLHVSFTDDFRLATFRVAIPDNAATADFAVLDDIDAPEGSACEAIPATRSIVGSSHRSTSSSVSYLSHGAGPADYRIFGAQGRGPDRGCPWRAYAPCRIALQRSVSASLTMFSSRRGQPRGFKHFARSPPHRRQSKCAVAMAN